MTYVENVILIYFVGEVDFGILFIFIWYLFLNFYKKSFILIVSVFSKPLNLSVIKVNDTSIELYWNAPEEAIKEISGYYVYYMAENHTSQEEILILSSQPAIEYTLNYLCRYL